MAKPKRPIAAGAQLPPRLPPGQAQGPQRPYFSTNTSPVKLQTNDGYIAAGLFALGLITRSVSLYHPNVIVFDEVHITNHINKYIIGDYFNDVTPPLSKLVYFMVAALVGYNGDSPALNKAGQSFDGQTFPYAALRFATVVFSSLVLPLAFLSLRQLRVSPAVAGVTAGLLLLENMTILHARLYTPDSLFLLGIALSVYSFVKFNNATPFRSSWLRYLLLTGLSLGVCVSTKWIGAATIVWVVAVSLVKLWVLIGDLSVSNCTLLKHAGTRLSLILVPLVVYLATFGLHLSLLTNYTKESALLSTDFQRGLKGNDIENIPKYVTYGSTVTLRHIESIGGYLHSHPYKYKGGTKQNQVTVFDYKDFNNEWIIESLGTYNKTDPRIVLGSAIRLRHKLSGTLLSVSTSKPPISEQEYDFEVSCLGNWTYTANDTEKFWIKDMTNYHPLNTNKTQGRKYLTSFDTQFALRNHKQHCTVLSHDLKLPEWGFGQQEVICIKDPNVSRSKFVIEQVKYPRGFNFSSVIPELREVQPLRPVSFLSKVLEVNLKMLRLLRAIKARSPVPPLLWPSNIQGMKYLTLPESTLYAVGNQIIYVFVASVVPVLIIFKSLDLIQSDYNVSSIQYKAAAWPLALGWAAHYLPYVLQEGQWFVAYYLPSLYFGILLLGVTLQYVYAKNQRLGQGILALLVAMALGHYFKLKPVTYGSAWTKEACEAVKNNGWDFRCDVYK